MSSKTKIIVLRSKELVYALVLLVVSILIIMVAVSLFIPADKVPENSAPAQGTEESLPETEAASPSVPSSDADTGTPGNAKEAPGYDGARTDGTYIPGIYSSSIQLGSSTVGLQVAVDKNRITSIDLTNLDESVATLYPLMQPTFTELVDVILSTQSLENVSYNNENRYTSMLLIQAISDTLEKAVVKEHADSSETVETF